MAGISNGDFSSFSLGEDIILNGDFSSGDDDWTLGSGFSVNETTDKLEHDGSASSNATQDPPGIIAYRSWKVMIDVDAIPGGAWIMRNTIWEENLNFVSPGIGLTEWRCNMSDNNPTRFSLRCTNTDLTTSIADNITMQEVTLDDWTLIGDDRSETEFVEINGEDTTVRLVSATGQTIGFEQECDNGTYKITPDITVTSGTIAIGDGGSNIETGINDNTSFDLVVATGKIQFYTEDSADADILLNELDINAYPVAEITHPEDGETVGYGLDVSLEGTGSDLEGGPITGPGLTWSSSIDGALGSGSPLVKNNLSEGTHTITLTATDSDSNTGTDTIQLIVSQLENNFESNYTRWLFPRGEDVDSDRNS